MDNYIYLNSIMKNPSLCDGPGYRTVIFLQGCYFHCKGCQNKTTWDITKGKKVLIKDLVDYLRKVVFNKKITISGGEPLMQKEALLTLLKELEDFDICLYTGHEYNEVPKEILKYVKYIKVGKFIQDLKTSIKPYVGSSNQELIEVKLDETTK